MESRRSFYCGIILSASRNQENRMQFLVNIEGRNRIALYSRNSHFTSPWLKSKSTYVGHYTSPAEARAAVKTMMSGMSESGITIPVYSIKMGQFSSER